MKRLLYLKSSIEQLQLELEENLEKDAEELDLLLLDEAEWIAISEIIKILEKFANATKLLSGSHYPTLSFTYPIICELFKHLSKMKESIKSYEANLLNSAIYESMNEKWNNQEDTGIIAAFFDPRFKSLKFVNFEKANSIIELIKSKILELENLENFNEYSDNLIPKTNLSLSEFFGEDNNASLTTFNHNFELETYLKLPQLSCNQEINLLDWWNSKSVAFPYLAKLAKIYLCIPATSVPSERLFSTAGNVITDKRNRLHPNTISNLLFLNQNSKEFNIFLNIQ
jgi:hypothetical protein